MNAPDTTMSSPVFIVGANRSGTTLLRLMLNAHSRIAIPDEMVYFHGCLAGASLGQWRQPAVSDGRYAAFVDRFLEWKCAPRGLDTEQLRQDIFREPPNLRRPYRLALEAWARRYGKARWGEKTPGNLFFVGVLLEMFPQARFLYLARDPRAAIHSMNWTDFLSNDTTINALNRRRYTTDGRALLEEAVPARQRLALRYEDLVTRPEETMRQVCAFLEEAYEPSMLRFHEDAEQYMRPRAARTFNRAATRPVDASRTDAWRGELSRRDVSVIEAVCRDEMQRFGYEPHGRDVPGLRARLDVLLKRAYYRMQRWRHPAAPQYLLKERVLERSRRRLGRVSKFLSAPLRRWREVT